MHRPGVDYWAKTHSSTQLPQPVHAPPSRSASSSSGPPSLSRTSTADFFIHSDDTALHGDRPSLLGHRGPLGSSVLPHHASSTSDSVIRSSVAATASLKSKLLTKTAELEKTQKQLAQLQQQQRHEGERASRMHAVWTRERAEYGDSLKTLQASLDREHALRTAAEQERQAALHEGYQLRAALRALLGQPPSHNSGAGKPTTVENAVPVVLYEEARCLLLQCQHAFDELKMLQLKATDAAGLERLRRYNVPVLDGIPPAWSFESPLENYENSIRNNRKGVACEKAATAVVTTVTAATDETTHHILSTPKGNPVTATASPPAEETPTGPEVSALTTVSPDTPCSPAAQDSSASLSHFHLPLQPVDHNISKAAAEASVTAGAPRSTSGGAGGGSSRRALMSPPILSPSIDVSDEQRQERGWQVKEHTMVTHSDGIAEVGWSGPMHKFARNDEGKYKLPQSRSAATTPALNSAVVAASSNPVEGCFTVPPLTTLHPQPGAPLSALEREDVIRDTDKLIRQLARETVALAKSHGVRHNSSCSSSAADLAALCRCRGLDYIDLSFLPVTETLGLADGGCRGYDPERGTSFIVQWCTKDVFVPNGEQAELLTDAGVDPNALRCGQLGDVGVVAAFAALAEATGAVTSVLASTTNESVHNGLYVVWLCVHGWWTQVTVDAYLPCLCEANQTVMLYGCRNAVTHDLWGSVCEKALAKVYGTYQALLHLGAEAVLGHLTGGPVECWDWWRRSADTALEEIEAAVNTNARGAGIVLLTTYSGVALHDTSNGKCRRLVYERLGLLPGTSYRVLAVMENADGEALLLLRNWTRGVSRKDSGVTSTSGKRRVDRRDISPLREDDDSINRLSVNEVMLTYASQEKNAGDGSVERHGGDSSSDEDGCMWLHYTKEVLPLFDKCHACFDCRRFHDVRFPIRFVGSTPAVPMQLIRVRVRDGRVWFTDGVTPCPTRLWIGLHQPCGDPRSATTSGAPVAWSLKTTLIGQEVAPSLSSGWGSVSQPPHSVRPARRSYVLSESFMGESQPLPAVWMFVELDPTDMASHHSDDEDSLTTMEFFVVPQMERIRVLSSDNIIDAVKGGAKGIQCGKHSGAVSISVHGHSAAAENSAKEGTFYDEAAPLCDHSGAASGSSTAVDLFLGASTTAIVAILAEHRESVAVDVVEAPEELRAAVYHDVVDRIDFSECVSLSGLENHRRHQYSTLGNDAAATADDTRVVDMRCQVNGRCLSTFSW